MNSKRLAALAAIMLLTVSACGKDEPETTAAGSGNTLLSYVPVATPFLAANLEPTPDEVIDSFLQKAQPVLAALQEQVVKLRAKLESRPEAADKVGRLALAILQELDGKLTRPGIQSLGFDLQSPKVFYGMGVYPVARIGLSDAAALKNTIQRVFGKAGFQAKERMFDGQAYWRVTAQGSTSGRKEFNGGLYIAILQNHLVISVFPTQAESELLPLFLGLTKPDVSNAARRLAQVNAKYGFTPYFTGLLDLNLLADELLQPDSLLASTIGKAGAASLHNISDDCKAEFRRIISQTPRMVAGTTELTPNAIGTRYIVETRPELAEQLAGLVAKVPGAEAVSTRMLEFSFGLKIGPLRDFLRDKALAITRAPYRCENLQRLNPAAAEASAKLNQPMPPLVNNFRGLRLSLSRFSMNHSMPEALEGLLAVHVEQPEMFVGMAQMFLPDLASLNLVKGDPPVQIPPSLVPMPGVTAFAALSDSAIGIAFGAGEESGLPAWLKREPDDNGTFMSMNYDTAAYLDLTRGMRKEWQGRAQAPAGAGGQADSHTRPEDAAREIADAVQQAYKTVAGRTELRMRFTDDGMVMDSRMTFKEKWPVNGGKLNPTKRQ